MSAAVLCPAFCAWDVTNKVGMRGMSVYFIMSQPFLLFSCKRANQHGCTLGKLKFEKKKKKKVPLLQKHWQSNRTTTRKRYMQIYVLGQLESSLSVPVNNSTLGSTNLSELSVPFINSTLGSASLSEPRFSFNNSTLARKNLSGVRWLAQICRNLVSFLITARWLAQICRSLLARTWKYTKCKGQT